MRPLSNQSATIAFAHGVAAGASLDIVSPPTVLTTSAEHTTINRRARPARPTLDPIAERANGERLSTLEVITG